jgi:hypothetical protein
VSSVGVKNVGSRLAVSLGKRRRPASVADTSSDVTRKGVGLGSLEVHIMSASRAVVVEEGVLIGSVVMSD